MNPPESIWLSHPAPWFFLRDGSKGWGLSTFDSVQGRRYIRPVQVCPPISTRSLRSLPATATVLLAYSLLYRRASSEHLRPHPLICWEIYLENRNESLRCFSFSIRESVPLPVGSPVHPTRVTKPSHEPHGEPPGAGYGRHHTEWTHSERGFTHRRWM